MREHERAVWEAAEATTGGTDEAATTAQQGPAPALPANDEDARHERFMEIA